METTLTTEQQDKRNTIFAYLRNIQSSNKLIQYYINRKDFENVAKYNKAINENLWKINDILLGL